MSTHRRKLNDVEWLRKQYHREGRTLADIGDEVGVTQVTVQNYMEKHDIERRDTGASTLETGLLPRFRELLDGELLGDGYYRQSRTTKYGARYEHGTSREQYRDWLASVLEGMGFTTYCQHQTKEKEVGEGTKTAYFVRTHAFTDLLDEWQRWYPEGEKCVPVDLEMSPLVLRQWYIGDGGINGRCIRLYTNGFDARSRKMLVGLLDGVGIAANVQKRGVLAVPAACHDRFFEYMAPLPASLTDVYGYKWPDET